jgi:beta-lactam-binding protein with PASTA domain
MVVACLLVVGAGAILVQASAGHEARTVGRPPPLREVPYVVGLPILKAALELQRDGFRVSIPRSFAYGTVAPMPSAGSQSVASGEKVTQGTVITLTPHAVCCPHAALQPRALDHMPQLLARSGSEAIRSLIAMGLPWKVRVRPVDAASDSILGAARVVDQWPAAGEPYPQGEGPFSRPPTVTVDYGFSTNS